MRTKITFFFLIAFAFGTAFSAAATESITVALNKKNFVYLVFDGAIQDIIYDNDAVEDEKTKRKDMIGLRLTANDTAPIGCLVVMEGSRIQHLWLKLSEQVVPVVYIRASTATSTVTAQAGAKDTVAEVPVEAPNISVKQERDLLYCADSIDTERTNNSTSEPMRAKAKVLLGKAPTIYQLGGEKGKVSVLPQNIGVDATHLYLTVEAYNTSNVDYYIDIQGFQINHKRKGLAAGATGKEPLQVVGSWNEPQVIRAQKKYKYILVYELFTLKKNQALEFFIREKNGGRNIDVEVPSKYLYENTYQL